MASAVKIKRGDGAPVAGADGSNGVWPYELAWDYTNNKLYINDNGTMREVGGGSVSAVANGSNNRIATFSSSTALNGEANLTFDGTNLDLPDSKKVRFGTDNDFEFYHDDTNAVINNTKGDLQIYNNADDKDIVLLSDDASGGTTAYLTIDGSESRLDFFSGRIYLKNDGTFHWGSAAAHGVLSWDTGRAIVSSLGTNNLDLKAPSGKQVVVNESGSNVDFRVEGDTDTHLIFADASTDRVGIGTSSPNSLLHIADGVLSIGTGHDLEISHSSGQNYIDLDNGNLYFRDESNNNILIVYREGGGIQLSEGHLVLPYGEINDAGTDMNIVSTNALTLGTESGTALTIPNASTNVGIGTTSPAEKLHIIGQCFINGQLYGGFGARTTGGTADWNHSTNARSGNGHTLLLSTATNGPTAQTANTLNTAYYHTLNFEYAGYDNDGNMTQIGIPYYFANKDGVSPVIRSRYSGTWSQWHSIPIANQNGSIQGSKGSASNPSYVFNQGSEISEPDTGMFCPGANMIGFSTGGTEKMRIDSSGRVLIGDTSVHYSGVDLQVGSTSDSQNGIQIQTSTTGYGYVLFGDGTGASAYRGQISYKQGDDFLNFITAGAERMRIDSSGHVGINETSPTTELHFGTCPDARAITFDQSGRFNGIGNYYSSNATDSYVDIYCSDGGTNGDTNSRMKIYADGRLKLTNSNNVDMLLAKATQMGYSNSYRALVIGETSGNFTNCIGYDPSGNSSGSFTGDGREVIFRNGVEFTTPNSGNDGFHNDILVLKDGKVGIGTSSPDSYNSAGRNLVVADSGDSGISIVAGTSSDSSIMFADGTGGTAGYRGRVAYDHNGDYLRFDTAAAERIRIDSAGLVGIGTSSPGAQLDIENSTAPTLDNDTHAGEALFLRSGGSGGDGNVQAVLAFGKADSSSRRSGSAIASVQTDSDVDKVGIGFYTSDSSASSQTMDLRMLVNHTGNLHVDADVVAYSTSVSDKRLKDNVKTIDNALDKVMQLRGVEFDWNKAVESASSPKQVEIKHLRSMKDEAGKDVSVVDWTEVKAVDEAISQAEAQLVDAEARVTELKADIAEYKKIKG